MHPTLTPKTPSVIAVEDIRLVWVLVSWRLNPLAITGVEVNTKPFRVETVAMAHARKLAAQGWFVRVDLARA